MSSFFTLNSSNRKRTTKIQFAALTAVLLLALVVLPVSADHEEGVEYISVHGSGAAAVDAGSARLAALGEYYYTAQRLEASYAASASRYSALASYYTAQRLEASHAASASRYSALASIFGQAGSVVVTQDTAALAANPELKSFSASAVADSDFYAENPEAKYANGWGGSSAAAAASGSGSENPELSAFEQYCGC